MSGVVLDYTNMLRPALGGAGLDPARLEGDLEERFREALDRVEARREAGEMGFFELPYAREAARTVQEVADGFGQWFENLVVLGIGGSALGARTLRDALLGPFWNELDGEGRDHYPRLYVLDNVDPATVSGLLDRLDLRRTLFNVVSKSGSTAETMAQYLVVEGRLRALLDEDQVPGHFLFTTDPTAGALRAIAGEEGIPALDVPENVGGRFSVLSAVGLLPAAVAGIDVTELLDGAVEMERRCRAPRLAENPAGLLATLLHAADTEWGAPIHVLMPYCDRLRSFSFWFQQLWAESLGKTVGEGETLREVGPTPLPALGVTDQHSLLQLFMEGPRDKVVLFLGVDAAPDPVQIPGLRPHEPALGYLGGHSLAELLKAERRATAEALRRRGRPSMTLEVEALTPRTLGELFMLFEAATVLAGALYGVDPLDQPGVELGKRLTYGMLGREGYEGIEDGTGSGPWRV